MLNNGHPIIIPVRSACPRAVMKIKSWRARADWIQNWNQTKDNPFFLFYCDKWRSHELTAGSPVLNFLHLVSSLGTRKIGFLWIFYKVWVTVWFLNSIVSCSFFISRENKVEKLLFSFLFNSISYKIYIS